MTSFVLYALDRVRSGARSIGWEPLVNASRHSILSLLSQIKVGRLTVRERDGTKTICGKDEGADKNLDVSLGVLRDVFWVRLALFADMVCKPLSFRERQLRSLVGLCRIFHVG